MFTAILGAAVGAIITGFLSSNTLTVNIDGQSMTVNSSQYEKIVSDNIQLTNTVTSLQENISDLQVIDARFLCDGLEKKLTDSKVLIYNDIPFFPLSTVKDISSKNDIFFDSDNLTLNIGTSTIKKDYLLTVCPPYEFSHNFEIPPTFKMGGDSYSHGFTMEHYADALFNFHGNYNTLEFDIGHIDETSDYNKGIFSIYLDGIFSEQFEISAEDLPKHMKISLHNAKQFKIQMETGGSDATYGFANVIIY